MQLARPLARDLGSILVRLTIVSLISTTWYYFVFIDPMMGPFSFFVIWERAGKNRLDSV